MIYLGALLAYAALYAVVCIISDRYTPLVGIGGLVAILTVAGWLT